MTGSNLFVDGGWEQTAYPNIKRFHDEALAGLPTRANDELAASDQAAASDELAAGG